MYSSYWLLHPHFPVDAWVGNDLTVKDEYLVEIVLVPGSVDDIKERVVGPTNFAVADFERMDGHIVTVDAFMSP